MASTLRTAGRIEKIRSPPAVHDPSPLRRRVAIGVDDLRRDAGWPTIAEPHPDLDIGDRRAIRGANDARPACPAHPAHGPHLHAELELVVERRRAVIGDLVTTDDPCPTARDAPGTPETPRLTVGRPPQRCG